jgi:putative PIN family toxin of toxin-antitoxin system
MRFVLDTNVLISSTLWHGSVSQKLVQKLIAADEEIFSSEEIILEYQKVLRRDFNYGNEEINRITNVLFSFLKLIEPTEKLDVIKDDTDDNKIIECAAACKADFIATYDKHLLKLKEFCGIKISMPESLLKSLK